VTIENLVLTTNNDNVKCLNPLKLCSLSENIFIKRFALFVHEYLIILIIM